MNFIETKLMPLYPTKEFTVDGQGIIKTEVVVDELVGAFVLNLSGRRVVIDLFLANRASLLGLPVRAGSFHHLLDFDAP